MEVEDFQTRTNHCSLSQQSLIKPLGTTWQHAKLKLWGYGKVDSLQAMVTVDFSKSWPSLSTFLTRQSTHCRHIQCKIWRWKILLCRTTYVRIYCTTSKFTVLPQSFTVLPQEFYCTTWVFGTSNFCATSPGGSVLLCKHCIPYTPHECTLYWGKFQGSRKILRDFLRPWVAPRDPREILRVWGNGFSNTSQVLVDYRHSLIINLSTGSGTENPSLSTESSRFPPSFALGKSFGSQDISRASGMDFPIPRFGGTRIQCYPVGKEARFIHPFRMEQIDSVKINPSLVCTHQQLYTPSIWISSSIWSVLLFRDIYWQVIHFKLYSASASCWHHILCAVIPFPMSTASLAHGVCFAAHILL